MCINQLAGIDRIPSAPIPQLGLSNILILILILKIWGRKGEGGGEKGEMPPLRNWSQSNIIQPCLYGDSIDRLGNLKPAFTLGIQFIQFRPLTSLTSRCDGVKLGRAGRKMASLLLAPQPAPSRSIPLLSLSLSLNPSYYADFFFNSPPLPSFLPPPPS